MSKNTPEQTKKPLWGWYKNHISAKMISSIVLLIVFTCTAFSITESQISNRLTSELEGQFDLRLASSIQSINTYLESIPENPSDIDSLNNEAYKKIKAELEDVLVTDTLENVYILSNSTGKEQLVILTGVDDDYGTEYAFSDEMKEAISSQKMTYSSIYKDEYGIHKSVFLPLKDSNGNPFGIAGIDIDASVIPATQTFIFWFTVIIVGAVIVIGVTVAFLLSRSLTRPINKLVRATKKVAEGDLTEEFVLKREDELGTLADSFNAMRGNLESLIHQISNSSTVFSTTAGNIHQASGEMGASSHQVALSMNSVNEGVSEVVVSINDSTSSIVEVNEELANVTNEVTGMQQMALEVSSYSQDGQVLVEKTLNQMNVIQQEMKQSQEAAVQLDTRSKEISDFITVITHIATQTNLLALNASIEAAHVGEHGKGFAVVAGEVKKLAEQSSNAAKSITELINSTQQDSQSVLTSIEQGSQAVEQGQEWINKMSDNFKIIFDGVSSFSSQIGHLKSSLDKTDRSFELITDSMQKISGITEEQSAGYQEVGAAIEEQSATIQEIAGAIRNLSQMADELQASVQYFKVS
ncbi:methyl-accepting chemotaxis protein [Saccharibacillus sacchari]|uniref:Methyl-accepting chemotaxis protein n=1 Tax=Saccharibacillus sacchari TaxID=456493 RepID=A0ACC6P9U7_9BACL